MKWQKKWKIIENFGKSWILYDLGISPPSYRSQHETMQHWIQASDHSALSAPRELSLGAGPNMLVSITWREPMWGAWACWVCQELDLILISPPLYFLYLLHLSVLVLRRNHPRKRSSSTLDFRRLPSFKAPLRCCTSTAVRSFPAPARSMALNLKRAWQLRCLGALDQTREVCMVSCCYV